MSEYKFKINGNDYEVSVNSVEGNVANVTVNGAAYSVEIEGQKVPAPQPAAADPAPAQTTPAQPSAPAAAKPAGSGKPVCSPLPGVVIEVSVKEGDTVKAGQKVAVIEAMKMENEIQAESAGTVTAIHTSKGASLQEGDPIVTIA